MKPNRTLRGQLALCRIVLPALMSGVMATAEAGDYLYGGGKLTMGQSISSSQGKYSLVMQTDGNLVMYRNDGTVRYRFGSNGWFAEMQADGNFVEYNVLLAPVFNTGTWGNPGALLHIQDDGNLVVYSKTWAPLWNIGAEPLPTDPKLPADVVGRDLATSVFSELGHVGVYDGSAQVIEAENQSPNAIRIVTLNQYKSVSHNYWGSVSANIPSGSSIKGCYRVYCYTDAAFEQFEMRVAIARAAYAANRLC